MSGNDQMHACMYNSLCAYIIIHTFKTPTNPSHDSWRIVERIIITKTRERGDKFVGKSRRKKKYQLYQTRTKKIQI